MANHSFTIADILEMKGVTLNIPPMKVNDQLSETELITTRQIAALRINIERAIGRIKKGKRSCFQISDISVDSIKDCHHLDKFHTL